MLELSGTFDNSLGVQSLPIGLRHGFEKFAESVSARGVKRSIVFLILLAAFFLSAIGFYRSFPMSWTWGELLVNYQGGFTKRGLVGQVAYMARPMVSERIFLTILIFATYSAVTAVFVFVLGLADDIAGRLFLFSPVGWFFPVVLPWGYGRKDAFVVAGALAALLAIRHLRASGGFAAMAIFVVSGLIVEVSWFYFPLVFSAYLVVNNGRSSSWKLGATLVAATYVLGCLALTMAGPHVNTEAIASSWSFPNYKADMGSALCCLNFGFASAFGIGKSVAHDSALTFSIGAALGLIPTVVLLARRRLLPIDALTGSVILASIIAAMFPLATAADWGRYIHLELTVIFLATWFVSVPRERAASDKIDHSYNLVGILAVAFYASTWQLMHFQFAGKSAVIPGIFFRFIGASALPGGIG
jgi:hypothetical protein